MNKSFWEIYEEERGKLTPLPDSDADFVALAKAYEILENLSNKQTE